MEQDSNLPPVEYPPLAEHQRSAEQLELRSPDSLTGIQELGPDTSLAFDDFAVTSAIPNEQRLLPGNTVINGTPSLDIKLGTAESFVSAEVFDLSNNPHTYLKEDVGDHKQFQIGTHSDGSPATHTGQFVLLLKNMEGNVIDAKALTAGKMLNVGREAFKETQLPLTVSRDHAAIGIDERGKLVIENHQPTNHTWVERPQWQNIAAPEVVARSANLDKTKDMTFDFHDVVPLSNQAEVTETLGLTGDIVGHLDIDSGEAGGLIRRQKHSNGNITLSFVRYNADNSLVIQELTPDKPIIISNEDSSDPSVFQVSADSKGQAHFKKLRQKHYSLHQYSNSMLITDKKVGHYQQAMELVHPKRKPRAPQQAHVAIDSRTKQGIRFR